MRYCNTFSYHIIKTINLYNIKNFIKNFSDNIYILPKNIILINIYYLL